MPAALPIPAAHTVTDLRVGMIVQIVDQRDAALLYGGVIRLVHTHMGNEGVLSDVTENTLTLRDEYNGRCSALMPVVCKIISLPRGATVDASELRAKSLDAGNGDSAGSVDACDRPCSCEAGKRKAEGPSEWTVVSREVQREPAMDDGSYSAEHVTVQRGKQIVRFRVVAHHDAHEGYFATVASREAKYSSAQWGCTVVSIYGEACIDMALARLLVGLRERTVVP